MKHDTDDGGIVERLLVLSDEEGGTMTLEAAREFREVLESLEGLAGERERVHTRALIRVLKQAEQMIQRQEIDIH